MGILASNSPDKLKIAKKPDKLVISLLSIAVIAFSFSLCLKAYPMWKNEWKLSNTNPSDRPAQIAIIKETMDKCADPSIVNSYAGFVISTQVQSNTVPISEFEYLEKKLTNALSLSPNNAMSKTYLGLSLSMQKKFEAADDILEGFTRSNHLYYERLFPWRTVYLNHLSDWADYIAHENKPLALSIINEALSRLPLPGVHELPNKTRNFENKLKLEKMMLEELSETPIIPDDSWKKKSRNH